MTIRRKETFENIPNLSSLSKTNLTSLFKTNLTSLFKTNLTSLFKTNLTSQFEIRDFFNVMRHFHCNFNLRLRSWPEEFRLGKNFSRPPSKYSTDQTSIPPPFHTASLNLFCSSRAFTRSSGAKSPRSMSRRHQITVTPPSYISHQGVKFVDSWFRD